MSTFVTGATGFVGIKLLEKLDHPVICSRNSERAKRQLGARIDSAIQWNPLTEPLNLGDRTFSAVVNLMGEPIAEGRWNAAKKTRIRDSRVIGTRGLVEALLKTKPLPSVFVSASAVGIYGDAGEAEITESAQHGHGFLTEVCEAWEAETLPLAEHGVRVVNLRIGIILGLEGGALAGLIPIFKWGIGGPLGNGQQWVPWIHIDDLVNLIAWCVDQDSIQGPVNATSPNPVRNKELTKQLAKHLNRPAFLPVPKFAVRLALGEFANSLFFSQKVIPEIALTSGFSFQFPNLDACLTNLLN